LSTKGFVVDQAFAALNQGVLNQPWLGELVVCCENGTGCRDLWLAQIEALKKLFVDNFSSSQSKVNRMSLEYQREIYNTQMRSMDEERFSLKNFLRIQEANSPDPPVSS
jgi:hypothetical protein